MMSMPTRQRPLDQTSFKIMLFEHHTPYNAAAALRRLGSICQSAIIRDYKEPFNNALADCKGVREREELRICFQKRDSGNTLSVRICV